MTRARDWVRHDGSHHLPAWMSSNDLIIHRWIFHGALKSPPSPSLSSKCRAWGRLQALQLDPDTHRGTSVGGQGVTIGSNRDGSGVQDAYNPFGLDGNAPLFCHPFTLSLNSSFTLSWPGDGLRPDPQWGKGQDVGRGDEEGPLKGGSQGPTAYRRRKSKSHVQAFLS